VVSSDHTALDVELRCAPLGAPFATSWVAFVLPDESGLRVIRKVGG